MKNKTNINDKKIDILKNRIKELEDENEELKSKLTLCDIREIKTMRENLEKQQKECEALMKTLSIYNKQYKELLNEMKKYKVEYKNKLKKNVDILVNDLKVKIK